MVSTVASVRKEPLRITVRQGHQIHLLRLLAPAVETRGRLLVLPGLGDDSGTWLAGDMPWVMTMARSGWDVYVADTRGKGFSLPRLSPQSDWGLQSLLDEEIPALVSGMQHHDASCAGKPWVAVAEDVAALALLETFASSRTSMAGLQGLLLLHAGHPVPMADLPYGRLLPTLGAAHLRLTGYARSPWLPGGAGESRQRFRESLAWLAAEPWKTLGSEPVADGLAGKVWPPTMYLAQEPHWVSVHAVQSLMASLPSHDARVLRCTPADLQEWRQHSDAAGFVGQLVNDWLEGLQVNACVPKVGV